MTIQARTYQVADPLQNAINARWTQRIAVLSGLIAVDMLMVGLGFWLAYIVRFEMGFSWTFQPELAPLDFYQRLVILLVPAWVIVFGLFGLYDFKNLFRGMSEYSHVFNATTLAIMLVISFTFFDPNFVIARAWVMLSWLLVSVTVSMGRFFARRLVQYLRVKEHLLTTALIIGSNDEAKAIAQQLQANRRAGVWVAGFVDDALTPGSEPLPGLPVIGSVDSLAMLVKYIGIQEIIVASTALPREKLLNIFQTFGVANDVTVRLSSGLYEMMTTGVEVQEIGNVPLLSVNKVRLTGGDVMMKGMIDFLGSLALLLVVMPIMALIGLAIKLDSPGPVFYKRRVVGVGGKLFDAFKFRTMHVDGDERLARHPELKRQLEQEQKLKDDPRVTRVGRILRRASLDEFPQLFNVLLGQMSLVGPRMITEPERRLYGKWRTNLLTVKPGMTGLWQVSGRSDVSYDERVALDMHYIRNYSIWLDVYLLWQTIPAVLKQRGAY